MRWKKKDMVLLKVFSNKAFRGFIFFVRILLGGHIMIGFIGIGVMGNGMVNNLLKAGEEVCVYSRTKSKADEVVGNGALWCDSVEEVVTKSDVVITMLGYPHDVKNVYEVMYEVADGQVFVDMTTSTPKLASELDAKFRSKNSFVVDAPVSGGDVGAKNGTLAIMCGGVESAFNKVKPLFEIMGKNISYLGDAGAGQHTKMANQIAVAGSMLALAESLVYAKAAGLSEEGVLNTISKGAAGSWSLDNYGPRILNGDFEPGFYVEHFLKDLKIVVEESDAFGLDLKGTKLVKDIYAKLVELGYEKAGTQVIYKAY